MDLLCPRLIGREPEKAYISDVVERHETGASTISLVLVGEGGIGKSRLVEWAREESGCSFLVGGFAAPPSVRRAVPEVAMAAVQAGSDPNSERLSLFRAALSHVLPGLSGAPDMDADPVVTASALIELAREVDGGPPVIVVEDVHWADEDSLAVIDQLVVQGPSHGVLVVVTARSHESVRVDHMIERWHSARWAKVLRMGPLSGQQVAEMVAACLGGSASQGLSAQIARESDGIPFFVEELLIALRDSGSLREGASGWEHDPDRRVDVPAAFTSDMARRLGRLSDQDRETTVLAALTGPVFDIDVLRRCGADADAIGRAIDSCRRIGLVVDGNGRSDAGRFRHALTRTGIVEASESGLLHRIATNALAHLDASGISDDALAAAAELAAHTGDRRRRIELLVRLGQRAVSRGGPSEALGHLDRAESEVMNDRVWQRRIGALRLQALGHAGDLERARDLGRRLLPTLTSNEDATIRRRCQLALARIEGAAGAWSDAQALLDSISGSATAEEMAFGAVVAMERHDLAAATRRADAARMAAIAAGSPTAECEAIEVIGRLARRRSYDAAAAVFEDGVRVAEQHDLRLWRARGLFEIGICDVTRFRDGASLDEAREAAIAAGSIIVAIMADNMHATMIGNDFDRCDDALDMCDRALSVTRRIGLSAWEARLLATQGQAHAAAGRPGEARACADAAIAAAPGDAEVEALAVAQACGFAALVTGEPAEALGHYRRAFEALNSLPYRTATMPWYDIALVGALWDPDGLGSAAREASSDPAIFPAVARWLPLAEAVVAGREGGAQRATELVESVLGHADAMKQRGRRWGRVDLWMRYVAEAAAADGWGHPEQWLVEAEDGLIAVRAHAPARGCRSVLRDLGAAPRARPDSAVPNPLAEMGVTRREVEVLRLLMRRLTNQQIADELQISPRTAKSHVEHLLTKTGRRNRAELAELACLAGVDGA